MAYPRASSWSEHYLGFGFQVSKGTSVAPTVFLPFQGDANPDHGMAGDEIRESGAGPYVSRVMKTAHDPSGTTAMACRPSTIASAAAAFLGADSIAGPDGNGLYDHTLTPDMVTDWLTIEAAAGDDGDIIERFVDGVFKELTFSVEGNGDLMASLGWFALSPAWQATGATPTFEAGIAGSTPGGPFRAADGTYTIDGSGATNVASFEVALTMQYDEDIRLSDVVRGNALKLGLVGTVKCKQLVDASAMTDAYRQINYGSASGTVADPNFYGSGAFIVDFDNGLTAGDTRGLTITVPSVRWTKAMHNGLNPDGQTVYVEREGTILKASGSELVTIAAQNTDSSAYV